MIRCEHCKSELPLPVICMSCADKLEKAALDLLAACKAALEFAKPMREEPIDSGPLEKHICELEVIIARVEDQEP